MSQQTFCFGVIEGFFGREWSWSSREQYVSFLKSAGLQFYIYAPKGDSYLRRKWREPWPESQFRSICQLASIYRQHGVQFGVGLSPFEIYRSYDESARADLQKKIQLINQIQPDILCILFDDMKGDLPRLAATQIEVTQFIIDQSQADRFIMCPTYYSSDPILEKVFGKKPEGYFDELATQLDAQIDLFWTGPKVCSETYPASHLKEVAQQLGRKPFIWDNYPVNDGAKRSQCLYLRAFENREHLKELTAGQAANPMNQAWLSKIPLWTLSGLHHRPSQYQPQKATAESLHQLCGSILAAHLETDIALFQDQGLSQLSSSVKQELVQKYSAMPSPFSGELVDWLQDGYEFDPACLTE